MSEEMLLPALWRNVVFVLKNFMATLVLCTVIGFISFLIGECVPRKWVRYDRFPFRAFSWENGGEIYRRLGVPKWKGLMPDMSVAFRSMFPKYTLNNERCAAYFERFVQETCIAELTHVCLLPLSVIVWFVFRNTWGIIASVLFGLGNIPFILIQRYNRPRFLLLMERQKALEERKRRAGGQNA